MLFKVLRKSQGHVQFDELCLGGETLPVRKK